MKPEDASKLLAITEAHVREKLPVDATGHDWQHCQRVVNLAEKIVQEIVEPVDLLHVKLAAWLHDLHDWKFSDENEAAGREAIISWLTQQGASLELAAAVSRSISEVSFRGAMVPTLPTTLEGKIVQDADRLESIGAVAIARTFAYGGYKHQALVDCSIPVLHHETFAAYKSSKGTSVNHFFEKLLLLKDRIHTEPARRLARERHAFMVLYLKQFFQETGYEAPGGGWDLAG